jgi:hypothetical protein
MKMMTMQLNNDAKDAVNCFWELSGEIEAFPRSLERASILALPIAIIKFPRLALGSIESWLVRRNIQYSFNCQSRLVRGCLIAFRGKGLLFCDGSDSVDEIRFTIAHEVAHFLHDYLVPRQKAINLYGPSVTEILDGIRRPTVTERISSLLDGVKIGLNTNLMERGFKDDLNDIWKIEDMADLVALELLAPSKDVFKRTDISGLEFATRLDSITQTLILNFGLPPSIARGYGNNLLRSINKGSSWVEEIRRFK